MPDDWSAFKVGTPSTTPNWVEPDCVPLSTVSHIAHVETACDILRDGHLRAGLIFDKSILNKDRILVSWLSPNDWTNAGGFRYGNVRFTFDWSKLVTGKNYYWVESIAYGIAACRILVTSIDRSSQLPSYDPTVGDGPWWLDAASGTHYWNSKFCLEIMIEDDLPLDDAISVDFVQHHPKMCNIDPKGCADLGLHYSDGGAKFVSKAIASGFPVTSLKMVNGTPSAPTSDLVTAVSTIIVKLIQKRVCSGNVQASSPYAAPLARAVLSAYARGAKGELDLLCAFFESHAELQVSCANLIGEAFGIADLFDKLS